MFQVKSGKIRITDPCYSKDTWCAGTVDALNGEWTAEAVISDEGSWGRRVAVLTVTHKDHKVGSPLITTIEAGVDSGQMSVFDEGAYPDDTGEYNDLDSFYRKACNLTYSEEDDRKFGYFDEIGFVSSSGYGDGCYPAEVFGENGAATKIVITFIDEEQEEEDDWDEDDFEDLDEEFDDEGEEA